MDTDHLLLALLDDPASTGAPMLTDLTPLSISEVREHLRRELAQQPTPDPPPHPHPTQQRRIHPRPGRRPHRRPEPRNLRSTTASPTPSNSPNSHRTHRRMLQASRNESSMTPQRGPAQVRTPQAHGHERATPSYSNR
ncbi:hypothetical protein [Rhodococcus jostii]|uniref:hypothetical protein n=1 Tax=Rhodococcus jostii TaxID=132919 RepID=UPI00365E480D